MSDINRFIFNTVGDESGASMLLIYLRCIHLKGKKQEPDEMSGSVDDEVLYAITNGAQNAAQLTLNRCPNHAASQTSKPTHTWTAKFAFKGK